jgi:hypothetical protein
MLWHTESMIIYVNTTCCKCGDTARAYGYDSEGDICKVCSPYWDCVECNRTLPVDLFESANADSPTVCPDCEVEVATRRAIVTGEPVDGVEVGG